MQINPTGINNPIFIDTEFTGLNQKMPDLISIALVPLSGNEFYRELNDFNPEKCNSWVRENVLAKLGKVMPIDTTMLKIQLLDYLNLHYQGNNENVMICFDFYGDWQFLLDILGRDKPNWLKNQNICSVVPDQEEEYSNSHHALHDARRLREYYFEACAINRPD